MATKTYYFEGAGMWPKLAKPDDYNGVEKYKISVVLDDLDLLKGSGVRLRTKTTEDGEMVTFSRPVEGRTMPDGSTLGGGKPLVVDSDGNPWDETRLIGNGSRVRVKVSVYDTRMGKGHRLEGVQVLEYIPYDNPLREQSEEPSVTNSTSSKKVPF